ncbi:MAG: hypothetical protein LC648_09485 [Novosphingobium sp.]|nr:hypothetical protein [Novosphingobium sp.]
MLPDPAGRGHAELFAELAAARSPAALAGALARRLTPDPRAAAVEGGRRGWPAWPAWAARRTLHLARRLADRRVSGEARSAARVLRWVQLSGHSPPDSL